MSDVVTIEDIELHKVQLRGIYDGTLVVEVEFSWPQGQGAFIAHLTKELVDDPEFRNIIKHECVTWIDQEWGEKTT